MTSNSSTEVRADISSICATHGFKFESSSIGNSSLECDSNIAKWTFITVPASNLLDQSWYSSVSQIDESTLAKSIWLKVISQQIIVN